MSIVELVAIARCRATTRLVARIGPIEGGIVAQFGNQVQAAVAYQPGGGIGAKEPVEDDMPDLKRRNPVQGGA